MVVVESYQPIEAFLDYSNVGSEITVMCSSVFSIRYMPADGNDFHYYSFADDFAPPTTAAVIVVRKTKNYRQARYTYGRHVNTQPLYGPSIFLPAKFQLFLISLWKEPEMVIRHDHYVNGAPIITVTERYRRSLLDFSFSTLRK